MDKENVIYNHNGIYSATKKNENISLIEKIDANYYGKLNKSG